MSDLNTRLKNNPLYGGLVFGSMVIISIFVWGVIINYPKPAINTVTNPGIWVIALAVSVPSVGIYVIFSSKYG